jgi:hypothetical protein
LIASVVRWKEYSFLQLLINICNNKQSDVTDGGSMRYNARHERGCSIAIPGGESAGFGRPDASSSGYPGHDPKVELTSLLPGGVTQDAESGSTRFRYTSSPEPVIGYGGMKGILAYYQAVLYFGTTPALY